MRSKSGAARRPRAPASRPGGKPDPVRLAAVRAFLAFEQGGELRGEPPANLRGESARAFYTHLLRGLVRHRRLLASEVARLADAPPGKLHKEVAALAMLGLYQLRFMEVPAHAAVFETVALAPALRQGRAKGWVNAVLRRAQREGLRGDALPDDQGDAEALALRTSHPDWLVARWRERFGPERAAAVCAANNFYQGAALRVETRRISPAALRQRLGDEGVRVENHPLLPGALWAEALAPLLHSRAFRQGLCTVQDVSSQLVTAWAAPLLQGRVLDVCAAPGGKLTHLLALPGAGRWPVGADWSAARLARVRENVSRLRLPAPPLLLADGARLPFADGCWDAVLLDAPCSATGMIRKYPELKWRKHESDLPRLAGLQKALLAEAARVTRPGGAVLYVTCSLEAEENEQVVDALLAARAEFSRRPWPAASPPKGLGCPPEELLTAQGDLLLLPAERQMGLYAALLNKSAAAGDGDGDGDGPA